MSEVAVPAQVQTISVQLNVPKECKEVVDAIVQLVGDAIAKKGLTEIAGNSLPKVLSAVDGFSSISSEVKSVHKHDLIGYSGREISKALGV